MNCVVISEKIDPVMSRQDAVPTAYSGSALQRPDISRARLDALLRRQMPARDGADRRTFWTAFLSHYAASRANAND